MDLLPVGALKTNFSEVLQKIQRGESVGITYGKKKKKVAVVIPYSAYIKKTKLSLGLLEGKASVTFGRDFKITDSDFLSA